MTSASDVAARPVETAADPAPPEGGYLGTRQATTLLVVLLVVNILNFLDRQLPLILAESIRRDLGLTDTQLGLIGGLAFAVCYALMALPLARLADRPIGAVCAALRAGLQSPGRPRVPASQPPPLKPGGGCCAPQVSRAGGPARGPASGRFRP